MSQLPRFGGQGTKNVKATTSRTVRIPGTNTTVSQSSTVTAEVNPCGSQVSVRAGTQTVPRPGGAGLRPPSGLRAPAGAQRAGRPEPCGTTTCEAPPAGRPTRPTGLPQVRLQGLPRSASGLPAPGQRPAMQQSRAGGLQQSQVSGMQRLQQPRPAPSGLQPPKPSGLQRPAPSGLQPPRPAPSGLQPPRPAGLQRPTPSGLQPPRPAGLQRPTPSGMQPPRPTGLQRPTPSGMQRVTPTGGLPRPSGPQQPRPTGLQRPTPSGLSRMVTPQTQTRGAGLRPPAKPGSRSTTPQERPGVCGGPCSAPAQSADRLAPTTSPVREPSPRHLQIPPQTPASVYPEFTPSAPLRPKERPRGAEAYKRFIFDSKYKLKKPKAPGVTPSPRPKKRAPAFVHPEVVAPTAPQRLKERPRGAEAYKRFIFDSKYKLKKPKAPGLTPSPRPKKRAVSAEERANRSLTEKSMAHVGEKVTARAASLSPCAPKYMDTPEGQEMIIKQAILEKRVERDEEGEKIVKNLQIIDADTGGMPKMIEMNLQQLDPRYPLSEGKEVISIASKLSMTESYTTVTHEVSRAITEPVAEAANMPPDEIAKLVEEENEDVDNTLKMLPPDLVLSPGKYEIKKRLQHLQLNSESVALLEQSIIRPEPRADEAQVEPTPEVMAAMMHTVEKGVPPQSTPDQVFNTLFVETSNERYIKLSPVTEGPLQDVVVPTEVPLDVHKEVITDDMEKLTEKLMNIPTAAELPTLDIFDQVMAEDKKTPSKGKNKDITFQPISDEKSLWVNANLEHLVNVVGATPVEVLDPADVMELETSGKLEEQMATGVEYFVDADPVQYMSRVQLRGTQFPSYFPGFMLALPEFPEVVKLASCPDEVFASAWKSAQPKYFPDESMQSMIY